MATATELMGLGLPANTAGAIGQARNAALTPAGSTSADAALVVSPVTTLGTSGAAGVKLPLAGAQPMYIIYNNSGANQTVYPYSTANTINATTSVTLTSAKVGLFVPCETGWIFLLGA
jgi:hypothetical protein